MFESLYKLYGGTDIRRLSIQLESQSERHDEILQNEESIEQSDFVHIQNRQDLDVDDGSVLSTVRNSDLSDGSNQIIGLRRRDSPSEKLWKKKRLTPCDRENGAKVMGSNIGRHHFKVEVHLRRLRILIAPIMDYFPNFPRNNGKTPFTIYISRTASIGTLHKKIVQSLVNFATNNGKSHPIKFLL